MLETIIVVFVILLVTASVSMAVCAIALHLQRGFYGVRYGGVVRNDNAHNLARAHGPHCQPSDRCVDWDMSIMGNHLREVQAERDEYRNALRGLYGLVKLLYVGADDVTEIKHHLATNHRSLEAARVLGVTPIGDGDV